MPARASSPDGTCRALPNAYYTFSYVAAQHDTTAKEFTFPIYSNGSKIDSGARGADAGMQDGVDLINAVAAHPATGPRLARKLYQFFISEVSAPDPALMSELSRHLLPQQVRDEAGGRAPAAVAAIRGRRRIATRGIRGRPSSSRGRSRKSAGPASR